MDFQAGSYAFNESVVRNGLVKNAIVYGKNGVGKSALGIGIFDIVAHLTDYERIRDHYLTPYCNQDNGRQTASFKYVFDFDGAELGYEYEKASVNDLRRETLFFNGEMILDYDYMDRSRRFIKKDLVGSLNVDLPDNRLSVIKYIVRNTPTNAVPPMCRLVDFCSGMLWYRSLSDGNDYAGFHSGPDNLDEGIYRSGRLDEFQSFLAENGIRYRLSFEECEGRHKLMVAFDSGANVPFDMVASTGTKALRLFFYWKTVAFPKATFLFVDEFDAFLHFESSAAIVRLLNSTRTFQTVLTSHNTNLMRNDLTRPDCCFIMTENGVTPLCKATRRILREGHNLEKLYVNNAFTEG